MYNLNEVAKAMQEPDEKIEKNKSLSPTTKLRVLQYKIEARKINETELSKEGLDVGSPQKFLGFQTVN